MATAVDCLTVVVEEDTEDRYAPKEEVVNLQLTDIAEIFCDRVYDQTAGRNGGSRSEWNVIFTARSACG